MIISKHISLKEAIGSPTAQRLGIDNKPANDILVKMKLIAEKVFEPLRNHFNVPIKIESFYRCKKLNTIIGGSVNSQHCKGEAMDIDDDFGIIKNSDMFYWIANNLEFDQLIWEFGNYHSPGWVHVSYKESGNRNKISIAYKINGLTEYTHFYNLSDFDKFKDKLYSQ